MAIVEAGTLRHTVSRVASARCNDRFSWLVVLDNCGDAERNIHIFRIRSIRVLMNNTLSPRVDNLPLLQKPTAEY